MTNHSSDLDPKRPLPLQQKISRLVESLANVSFAKVSSTGDTKGSELQVPRQAVLGLISAWQKRASYLPQDLLSDPAWGMLLELLRAQLEGRQVGFARLCEASAAPSSTAMRWLKALENHNLVIRRATSLNAEKESIELTLEGGSALHRYFNDVLGKSQT